MKEVYEILKDWLKENEFDGLYSNDYECGCKIDDLIPCDMLRGNCVAGYLTTPDKMSGYDFAIGPKKEDVPQQDVEVDIEADIEE